MNQSLKKLCAMGAAMVTLSSCSDNSNSGYNDYNGPAPIKVQYSKDGPSRGAYSGYNQQPQPQPQYQQPQLQQQPQRVYRSSGPFETRAGTFVNGMFIPNSTPVRPEYNGYYESYHGHCYQVYSSGFCR